MSQQDLSDEYYTVEEVAMLLKITRATVYKYMNTGALRFVQLGSIRRIERGELRKFLESRRSNIPPEIQTPDPAAIVDTNC